MKYAHCGNIITKMLPIRKRITATLLRAENSHLVIKLLSSFY
jgi:hypothetical protein